MIFNQSCKCTGIILHVLIRTKLHYGLSFNYLFINGLAAIYFILWVIAHYHYVSKFSLKIIQYLTSTLLCPLAMSPSAFEHDLMGEASLWRPRYS